MCKQRDSALVILMTGIRMNQFVQFRCRHHHVQQQDNSNQHAGENRTH